MRRLKNDGFTIVELMIATAVFSIVLLTISAAIIQIGRLYYKSITSARTQEVARTLMDDVTQSVQFNAGQIVGIDLPNGRTNGLDNPTKSEYKAICIAAKHYSFRLGEQQINGKHGLVQQDVPSGCSATRAQDLSGNVSGEELLGERMRLANLSVWRMSTDGTYMVTIRVVYGDADLLCSPNVLHNCDPTSTPMTDAQIAQNTTGFVHDLSCKNIRSGSQFCAVSELSTIVKRRLSDD